jgi:hypothetical protein
MPCTPYPLIISTLGREGSMCKNPNYHLCPVGSCFTDQNQSMCNMIIEPWSSCWYSIFTPNYERTNRNQDRHQEHSRLPCSAPQQDSSTTPAIHLCFGQHSCRLPSQQCSTPSKLNNEFNRCLTISCFLSHKVSHSRLQKGLEGPMRISNAHRQKEEAIQDFWASCDHCWWNWPR